MPSLPNSLKSKMAASLGVFHVSFIKKASIVRKSEEEIHLMETVSKFSF